MDKKIIKKIFAFEVICVYILAAFGCSIALFVYDQPVFCVVSILNSLMALPYAIQAYNTLEND